MEEDIAKYIKEKFEGEDAEIVSLRLKDYGSDSSRKGRNRLYRCILFLADGDLDKVDKYINLANIDFRDVIVPAEYDNDKHIRDFRFPFGKEVL